MGNSLLLYTIYLLLLPLYSKNLGDSGCGRRASKFSASAIIIRELTTVIS